MNEQELRLLQKAWHREKYVKVKKTTEKRDHVYNREKKMERKD